MKRTLSLLVPLLLFICRLQAQDTIISLLPPENYYYNEWFDTNDHGLVGKLLWSGGRSSISTAKQYYSQRPIKVYGIAVAYHPDWRMKKYTVDTILEHSFEYVGISQASGDTFVSVSDSMLVKMDNSQVKYYYHCAGEFATTWSSAYHPVREVYFDSAITLQGTFYLYTTFLQDIFDTLTKDGVFMAQFAKIPVSLVAYNRPETKYNYHYDNALYQNIETSYKPWFTANTGTFAFIFPILTPENNEEPEEPQQPEDSLAIDDASTMGKYVSAQPNPINERLQVLSSFEMSRVQMYDMAGQLCLDLPTSGLDAWIDVRHLSAGTYILKVHTALGIASQKVIISR